jgi:ATP synthase F1 gamma subunit
MSAINELKDGLLQIETAQFVTTMLRDISATKLQSLRARFEANARYFAELHTLMALVETYRQELGQTHRDQTEKGKEKKVLVAVTSNKRFYGMLNHEIIREFTKRREADLTASVVVIGQTGKQILEAREETSGVQFVSFVKDEPTQAELLQTIESLGEYQSVEVIHPTFINSFQQHAAVTDITHRRKEHNVPTTRTIDYVFEPEILDILAFFRTHIRMVLFERTMLETELAFTGARLMKMQRARERAGELVTLEKRRIHKEQSTVKSMRLLETFAGFHGTQTV